MNFLIKLLCFQYVLCFSSFSFSQFEVELPNNKTLLKNIKCVRKALEEKPSKEAVELALNTIESIYTVDNISRNYCDDRFKEIPDSDINEIDEVNQIDLSRIIDEYEKSEEYLQNSIYIVRGMLRPAVICRGYALNVGFAIILGAADKLCNVFCHSSSGRWWLEAVNGASVEGGISFGDKIVYHLSKEVRDHEQSFTINNLIGGPQGVIAGFEIARDDGAAFHSTVSRYGDSYGVNQEVINRYYSVGFGKMMMRSSLEFGYTLNSQLGYKRSSDKILLNLLKNYPEYYKVEIDYRY